jgi:hypothetical protein
MPAGPAAVLKINDAAHEFQLDAYLLLLLWLLLLRPACGELMSES